MLKCRPYLRNFVFCHPEFDKGAISEVEDVKMPGFSGGFSDFRELSFCGPCEPYFLSVLLFSTYDWMINFCCCLLARKNGGIRIYL